MSFHRETRMFRLRYWALALVAGAFILGPQQARGYFYDRFNADPTHDPVGNGTIIKWRLGSPIGIWTDATQTLTWHFNGIQFPQSNWPPVAAAGAAFEHGYKTIQDTTGTVLKIVRGADTTGSPPVIGDGRLDMCLAHDKNQSNFGGSLGNIFAVTYVRSTNGTMTDADIEFNGDPTSFTWATTGPPAPGGSNDIETTAAHEEMHSIGSGHPIYFYAMVWPTGRNPELLQYDRCISPDDRMLIRTLYPAANAFGTITGNVSKAGPIAVKQAVIVATDAAGVPQATVVTDDNGNYSINVPAGTYTVTAEHHINSDYNADIDFSTATDFLTSTISGATVVAAGATVANVNLTASGASAPTMTVDSIALNNIPNSPNDTNLMFLAPGTSGTINVRIVGPVLTTVSNVSLGPDITITGAVTVAGNVVGIPFSVSATPANPGVRNLTFTIPSGERLFAPAYVEVLAAGDLQVAASPGNPNAGIVGFSATDVPLLGVALTAGPVEDIRIHFLRFHISGSGPALPAVRLWYDNGTVGVKDGADVRLFTGNAYANNPPSETILGPVNMDILFDNIALTVKAGTTVNLLLTADTPASGSGFYTASLDSSLGSNIDPHGMFYGSFPTSVNGSVPLNVSGGTITGGTMTMASLGLTGLQQVRKTAGTQIAIGGFTNEPVLTVTLKGTPTSTTTNVGMDVEVRPVGTAFTNTPNSAAYQSATSNPSGTQISIDVPVVSGTSYHWQARPTSPTLPPGPWVVFGGNSDTVTADVDFSVDTSTTGVPTGLQQFQIDGVTVVPPASVVPDSIILSAVRGTSTTTPPGGYPVRLEFEVQPSGTPFTNMPTAGLTTAFGVAGTTATVTYTPNASGNYHWQVRTLGQFGTSSAWVAFGGPIDFHINASIIAKAGCTGRAAPGASDAWILYGSAGLALLGLSFAKRVRKFAGALALVLALSAVAQADEESPLPLSLSDWSTATSLPDTDEPLFALTPALAPRDSWFSMDAYLGMIFMPMNFQVTGTDLIVRKIRGIGTGVFGLEFMAQLAPDWRVGLVAEGDFYVDMRILAGGAIGTWRFASSRTNSASGRPEMEHFVKIGAFYEMLTVTKNNFGSFDGGIGGRVGYELRFSLSRNWALQADAEAVYCKWRYQPAVLAGNTSVGGFGGLITIGIVLLP